MVGKGLPMEVKWSILDARREILLSTILGQVFVFLLGFAD